MQVRVKLYGMLKVGVKDPDGVVELTLPDQTDVEGLIEIVRETAPMLDPRACLAIIGGASVPLDQTLRDGDEVGLYPTFSGG